MTIAIVALLSLILGVGVAILAALGVIIKQLADLRVEAHAMNEPLIFNTNSGVTLRPAVDHRAHVNPVNVGQYL